MVSVNIGLRVECYAGHRGEEEPRRFILGRRSVEIVEILDRWLSPEHRYFKVRGADNAIYILRHDTRGEGWELWMYQRPGLG